MCIYVCCRYCSNCKKHQCARKNVQFWQPNLPSVLIIVLKRFAFTEASPAAGAHREKINTKVCMLYISYMFS